MNVLLPILIIVTFVALMYFTMTFRTKSEKEYDQKLKESLKDEYLIDPETGVKLTLEEAESGHWISHNNEFLTIPESEIEKLPTEEERQAERAVNYLRKSKEFLRVNLSNEQFEYFNKSKILNSYDDWSYSNPFAFENGILIIPTPMVYEPSYSESHLMFWMKIENLKGHYYLREKTAIERFFDKFRNDDDLILKGYESFTIKRSHKIIKINKFLEHFNNQKGLTIEIDHDNLFIKTAILVNIKDIKRFENLIQTLNNTNSMIISCKN